MAEAAGHSAAESADEPRVALDRQVDTEPFLALSKLPGWAYAVPKEPQVVRCIGLNQALRADDFTPNVVVTLEDLTGRVDNPQQAIDFERHAITANVAAIQADAPTAVCGYPATTIGYLLEGRWVTSLVVSLQNGGGNVWAVTVTMQTTQPQDRDYLHARRKFLTGFQVKLADQQSPAGDRPAPGL